LTHTFLSSSKKILTTEHRNHTPVIAITYKYWEDAFLYWCESNNKKVADFDLEVWKSYAKRDKK